MIDTYSIPLRTLVEKLDLTILHESTDYRAVRLTVEDVARPGLQLAGYFDHFEPMRLQIMGNVEMSYLAKQSQQDRAMIYDRLFSYKFPALLISRGLEADELCLAMAKKHNVTVLSSQAATGAVVTENFERCAGVAPNIKAGLAGFPDQGEAILGLRKGFAAGDGEPLGIGVGQHLIHQFLKGKIHAAALRCGGIVAAGALVLTALQQNHKAQTGTVRSAEFHSCDPHVFLLYQ